MAQTEKTKVCHLLAISKTKPVEDIIAAYDAGQRRFGENYVDEFVGKAQELEESHPDIEWHFVGHLQSNKARKLAKCRNLKMVETVDSLKIANTLNKECSKFRDGLPPLEVLIQVLAMDLEGTKNGVPVDAVPELRQHIDHECPHLKFRGLMSMGAVGNVEEFKMIH